MNEILLIDGNNLAMRSYWAVTGLETSKGTKTNLIYGFMNSLRSIVEKIEPRSVLIVWDAGGETFRHKIAKKYKSKGVLTKLYKEGRKLKFSKEVYEDVQKQIISLKQGLIMLGVYQVSCKGVEADDIIGAFATENRNKCNVIIYSGDRDFFQLISKSVKVQRNEKEVWGLRRFKAAYGIKPKQWRDMGAITGDGSDSIEGVKGLGEKRALEIIKRYGSIKKIIRRKKKLRKVDDKNLKKVLDNLKLVKVCYKLKKIRTKPNYTVMALMGKRNFRELKKYFNKYEFEFRMLEFMNTFKKF